MSGFFSKVDFLAPADEDDPRVLRALDVENFLAADERIVWRARPSSRHAWGDHDQLEPVRGTRMQPASRVGRILVSSLCTALTLALAAGGWVLLTDAVETSNAQRWAGAAVSGMLGLTMLSGLPILFRPLVNMLRARRLGYVLTSRRALVVRRGPATDELWIRSPLLATLSATALFGGTLGLVGQWTAGIRLLFSGELGLGGALGLVGVGLVFPPIFGGLTLLGGAGLWSVYAGIRRSVVDRKHYFAREFDYTSMRKNAMLRMSRLRRHGVGDLVLDVDSDYQSDPNSGGGSSVLLDVGFLSVPSVETVAAHLDELLEEEALPAS